MYSAMYRQSSVTEKADPLEESWLNILTGMLTEPVLNADVSVSCRLLSAALRALFRIILRGKPQQGPNCGCHCHLKTLPFINRMLKSEKARQMNEEGTAEVKMPDGQTLQLPVLSVSESVELALHVASHLCGRIYSIRSG